MLPPVRGTVLLGGQAQGGTSGDLLPSPASNLHLLKGWGEDGEERIDTAVVHIVGEQEQTLQQSGSSASFSCHICSKEFKKSFNLKQHVRIHTNEKPLKCAQCEKRFNDRSSMNKHVRTVHSDLRPHKCSICEKSFATNSHLKDHQVTHTNQKQFQCLQCGKRFAFKSSLNKHMAVHSRINVGQWSSESNVGL